MARRGGFLSSDTVVPHRVRAFRFTPLNSNMEAIAKERKVKKKISEEEEITCSKSGFPHSGSNGSMDIPDTALKLPFEKDFSQIKDNEMPSEHEAEKEASDSTSSGKGSMAALQSSPVHRPTCLPRQFHTNNQKKNRDLSVWTSDGEMDFEQKAIVCYVHCQLLNIFGHGVDKQH
jgi:hypothetical protein